MNYSADSIILSSERLLLRQHTLADMDAFCAMETDAEVRRYVGGSPRLYEDAQKRFKEGVLQPVSDRLSMWATILKENGSYIGRCGVYPHFKPDGGVFPGEGTLAFYIAREYWGQGFATEAGRALILFGFDELHLKQMVAAVQVGNDASAHILKKLGFSLASTENGTRSFYHFVLQNPAVT